MVQIIPVAPQQAPSPIMQGLTSGLQSLLQIRMQQRQEQQAQMAGREQAQALAQFLGLEGEEAGLFAGLPPAVQQQMAAQQIQAQQSRQFLAESGLFGAPGREIDEISPGDRTRTTVDDLTGEQLAALRAHPDQTVRRSANAEFERRKQDRKAFVEDRKFETDRSKKFLEEVDKSRDVVRGKENAIDLWERALEEGDLSFFSRDNLANVTGIEAFRTAKGAEFITGTKEFLLGNIQRAGARPNMWIEKQISKMLPLIGRSAEANQAVVSSLKAETQIQRKKVELTDQLSEQFENELGYVPGNISRLVDQAMEPFAQEIQDQLAFKLRVIHERESGPKALREIKKVPPGTPLTLEKATVLREKFGTGEDLIRNAEKLGYVVPTKDQYERWLR